MITLDAIRAAILASDPYTQLDQLVRTELSAGRKVKEVFEAINPFVDEALDTPDLTEDGEEAFLGTLDALTGNCHRDCQYIDPPNNTLPTEDEIAKLPRWARVAFAARCARRVLPLFLYLKPQTKPDGLRSQRLRLERADLAASSATAIEPRTWYGDADWPDNPIDKAAHAILQSSTATILEATGRGEPSRAAMAVQTAVAGAEPIADIVPFIRRDFDHVAKLAEWQHWTDDTPVPPEVFGPLWPEGPPKGWPAVTDAPARTELAVALFPRERVDTPGIRDEVLNLFNALNRYHIARSGTRLTLEQFESLLPAAVPVEA
ncbi:MAG: hypothetical protein K8U57_36825 [Planctomycetes bacterium]|nr:hypothetical protein [Planctomycetota bacterium]